MSADDPHIADLQARLDMLRTLRHLKAGEREKEAEQAKRYLHDPLGWVDRYVGWRPGGGLAAYQRELLRDLVARRRVAARAPHGTGKSTSVALTVLWFADTRERAGIDWKVVTTASAWRHLTKYLWPEIHKWYRLLDWEDIGRDPYNERTELLDLTLKLKHGAGFAVASSKPEYIEGAHADSLLYVIDEAKIVPDASWDAIEGALSGAQPDGLPEAFVLAVSTPGPPRGRFYDIHRRAPGTEDWHTRHIKLEEAIAENRISRQWAEQRAKQWGISSALYANRVLGEFHQDDEDALIPLSWIEAAQDRWRAWDDDGRPPLDGRHWVTVDVARTGTDSTIIGRRIGVGILSLDPYDQQDTMGTASRVIPYITQGEGKPDCAAVVDSAGVGGGVVDRLRELKLPVLPYTGAAKTDFRDESGEFGFANTRSGAYWNLRQLLDPANDSEIILPPDDLLTSDLTTPKWEITSGVPPKIKVEPKEKVIEKLGRSPDRGDTVAMGFWAEQLRREAKIAQPVGGRLPVRPMSPLGQRSSMAGVRTKSRLGPLG